MSFCQNPDPGSLLTSPRSMLIGGSAALALLLAPSLTEAQTPAPGVPPGGQNVTAQVQSEITIPLPSLAPLVERVSPAVVTISAQLSREVAARSDQPGEESDQSTPFDDLLRRFQNRMRSPEREVIGLGSGFIIDPSGYVVTNNHVAGNPGKITVILQDSSRHTAKLIGRDEKTDLALLKIDVPTKLPYVSWGDSEKAKVGDWVVAVGNPFGLGGTVTAGIISALGRDINEGPYDDFIQIDAPINRGNSGGPTFDLSARVIGINTAIYSPSGGSVGIGFAVPSSTAKNVVAQLREHGHVTRGWLGVAVQSITPTIAKSLGLDPDQPKGALVASVTPNSPAAKAGIKQGDVILSANGHPIKTVHELPRLVAATPIGQKLDLTIRRNGKDMTVAATIAEMKENQEQVTANLGTGSEEKATGLGLQLSAIDPALRRRYHIPKEVEGVVVTNVASDSSAATAGIEPGDVIVQVDQKPVKTPQQAAEELRQAAANGDILLLLNRQGKSQFVGLSAEATGSTMPPR
jgi:serine protease Do